MLESLANAFVYALEVYGLIGFLFGAIFVSFGVQRLDSEARGAGIGFRLLILPGVAALWPMALTRWVRGITDPPIERNPHRILT
jgi:hypothetical protein